MTDEPASLLTRTQRERIRSDFAEVGQAKQRRDRQKIRARVAAGLADFELLAGYPDREFELAFEDVDDERLVEILADATLTVERIRELRAIDRDDVAAAADDRRTDLAGDSTESLEGADLRTLAERRREAEAAVADRFRPSRWERRSDALLKLGLLFLVPASILAVVAPEVADGLAGGIPGVVGAVSLVAGLAIVGVRGVKHDLVPTLCRFTANPRGFVRDLWNQL
ncbi:ABC transporter permease [Halorussus sp. AFM4]|uniref:ABC transporter permease n=1 Tax=Halorussus sp. AFM4 TaxID=3421651 RepID=UPI003EC0C0C0